MFRPNRRQLLLGAASAALAVPAMAAPATLPSLVQPREEVARGGLLRVAIDARMSRYQLGRRQVALRGYDGLAVGRTLRLRGGDTLRLSLTNTLPFDPLDYLCTAVPVPGENTPRGFNVTNMHLHGVHVSPDSPADNILLLVRPGQTQNYVYDIPQDHPPGTYFYHAHFHGSVGLQVASGMAGTLIIEGEVDDIPEIRAAQQVVMVFQTQRFGADGQCDDYALLQTGDKVYVNGQDTPLLRMRPGQVQRWRLVNSSPFHDVDLRLAGHRLTLLCRDGNPLPRTTEVDELTLIPGNRADLLVRASSRPGRYALTGGDGSGTVAVVEVAGRAQPQPLFSGALPQPPGLRPIAASEVTFGRRLEFGLAGGPPAVHYTINGRDFSCADPWVIPLGAVEEWEIYNHTAENHPFHIHVNPFQVVSGGDVPVGTWLDTLELPPFQRISFRTRFADYTGTFVFHCHNLVHEDMGMMQAVKVVPPSLAGG